MSERIQAEIDIFLKNVAYLRKLHGLSKAEMAKKLHIGVNTLTKIENGQLPPRVNVKIFFYIEKQFGISAQDLFKKLWE